jgi:hypothetical protein
MKLDMHLRLLGRLCWYSHVMDGKKVGTPSVTLLNTRHFWMHGTIEKGQKYHQQESSCTYYTLEPLSISSRAT